MNSALPPQDYQKWIEDRIQALSMQRANEQAKQNAQNINLQGQADIYNQMNQAGLYGGTVANTLSEHDLRMGRIARSDPQTAETLNAMMSLTGYKLDSWAMRIAITTPVDGEYVTWRLESRKWGLHVAWLGHDEPNFEQFKEKFGRLGGAIKEKREKLIADGKPLPADPVPMVIDPTSIQWAKAMQQSPFPNVLMGGGQSGAQNVGMGAAHIGLTTLAGVGGNAC